MSKENNTSQDWGSVDEETPKKFSINCIEITKENKWFYLLVVISLGIATIGTVAGAILLAYSDRTIPNALVAIGSVAVGALGGLFSRNN